MVMNFNLPKILSQVQPSPFDLLARCAHDGVMIREKTFAFVMAGGSGERFWPMPLPADYRAKLDSSVADIANIAEGLGGTLYGGLFLKEFVKESQSWIHLDIAAPAFNSEGPFDYTPKGATGSSVRTLVTIAEDLIAGTLKL